MTNYKYFNFDKSPYVNYECYYISGSTELWDCIMCLPQNEYAPVSLQVLEAALFGLDKHNFYNYIAATYNASIRTTKGIWKLIHFSNIKDANEYVKELNKRMEYAVAHNFFSMEEETDEG